MPEESAAWACGAGGRPHLLDDRADILYHERTLLRVALHLHRNARKAAGRVETGGETLAACSSLVCPL